MMLSTNKTMAIADFREHQYKRKLQQMESLIEATTNEFKIDAGLLNGQITKLEMKNTWLWTWASITTLIAGVEALALLLSRGVLNP